MDKCLKCGVETEYYCDHCGEPLCEDCGASTSPPELPLERHICEDCHAAVEFELYSERTKELEEKEAAIAAIRKVKDNRNFKARLRYHSPEAKARRVQKAKDRKEQARNELRQVLATLKDWGLS